MPKRTDINKILIIGSGPIIISQACEFDYSGTQACKALREEGFKIVLVNSNPATIMTDPETADVTYIEPITPEVLEKIIAKEKPDALLPTLGGQTALNTAMRLKEMGVLDKYNVKMIGADYDAIKKAEDRDCFKKAILKIGLDLPKSEMAHNMEEANSGLEKLGLPIIIRPSFTLGGTGGGIARTKEEFEKTAVLGLQNSMIGEILIEESILGWKEYELEVMRDKKDNVVIVCSIENFDPKLIKSLPLESNSFDLEAEVTIKLLRLGEKIEEVPLTFYKGRSYKEGKKVNWKDGLRAVFAILYFRFKPMD